MTITYRAHRYLVRLTIPNKKLLSASLLLNPYLIKIKTLKMLRCFKYVAKGVSECKLTKFLNCYFFFLNLKKKKKELRRS